MSREARLGFWLAVALLASGLLYLLGPILTPFILSAALAYLGDPLVDRIEAGFPGTSRTLAVAIVFVILFLALLLLVLFWLPKLIQQSDAMIANLPIFLDWIQIKVLPWLQLHLGVDPAAFDLQRMRATLSTHLDRISDVASVLLASIGKSSMTVLGWLAQLVLIPVVTFYLLRDWDILVARSRELLPRRVEPVISGLARETDAVLGAFLLGQVMVMLLLATIYSTGLFIIGLNFALVIGVLAGLLSFVPYLGLIVGMSVAGMTALIQFQDVLHLLGVLLVFGVGQTLESTLLTPLLVGDRIGLHPVAVIFAVLAGGHLFGFLGILLALPMAAMIMVLLRHTRDEYFKSVLYDE